MISNGIDLAEINSYSIKLPLGCRLYFGRICPVEGVEILIKLFKVLLKNPDLCLVTAEQKNRITESI